MESRDGRAEKAAQLYSMGNVNGRGREDACFPSPPETSRERACNVSKGHGMAADCDGNTATANKPGTCNGNLDGSIALGGYKMWLREHTETIVWLFTPIGAIRGPQLPYTELWELMLAEGITDTGRPFTITAHWMSQGGHKQFNETCTGKIHFLHETLRLQEGRSTSYPSELNAISPPGWT